MKFLSKFLNIVLLLGWFSGSSYSQGFTSTLKVTLHFHENPSHIEVFPALLKYKKDLAYSFTFDDGRDDAYSVAFKLYNGGVIEGTGENFPGLFYTDGCGNDIPFRGGVAWNSSNMHLQDIREGTEGFMTWDELREMIASGWDVLNHSYTHAAGEGTDYPFEISANQDRVKEKVGFEMTHFVIPTGDEGYTGHVFDYGLKAIYNQNNLPGGDGLDVQQPLNYHRFGLFRQYKVDHNHNVHNVTEKLDQVAAKSSAQHPYWYNEFTHSVGFVSTGGSLIFNTFKYYMNYIESTYGKSGADNIWMAPLQEVYEYLYFRDHVKTDYSISGNKVEIYFDLTEVPADFRKYATTLEVVSDKDFYFAEISSADFFSYRGNGEEKIINIEWNSKPVNHVELVSSNLSMDLGNAIRIFPNPTSDVIKVHFPRSIKEDLDLTVQDPAGRLLFSETISYAAEKKSIEFKLNPLIFSPGTYILSFRTCKSGEVYSGVIVKE